MYEILVEKRHYLDSYLITYVGYCSHGRNFEVDSYDLNRQWIIREENGHDYTIIFAPKWLLYITHRHIQLLTYICKLLSSQFFFKYMYQMNEYCTCYSYIQLTMIFICFNSNLLFKKKIFLMNIYENRNHALLQYEKCMIFTYVGFSALTKGS